VRDKAVQLAVAVVGEAERTEVLEADVGEAVSKAVAVVVVVVVEVTTV